MHHVEVDGHAINALSGWGENKKKTRRHEAKTGPGVILSINLRLCMLLFLLFSDP